MAPLLPRFLREEVQFNPYLADQFLTGTSFERADRLRIARGLALANERLGALEQASLYYQMALRMENAADLRKSLDAIRQRLADRRRDDARRPVVANHLEQDRLVRPKGVAR